MKTLNAFFIKFNYHWGYHQAINFNSIQLIFFQMLIAFFIKNNHETIIDQKSKVNLKKKRQI